MMAAVHRATETPAILSALQRVTDAALAYLPLNELLIELLNRIAEILGSDTAAFLLLAADRAAMAIEHARVFYQRRVVDELQRTLIPELLTAPGLELAASYRPAAVRGGIGGDWYDAFPLTGGEFALVIGDVMGHGI